MSDRALLGAMLDGMLEAVFLVHPETQRIAYANEAACRMLGQSLIALLDQPVTHLCNTPEDQAYWDEARAGRADALHTDSVLLSSDGRLLQIERRIQCLPMPDGHTWFLIAMLDQTQRHAAEDQLDRILAELRATIESTADGILVTDLFGSIRGFNRRFSQMWELPETCVGEQDDAVVYRWMRDQVEHTSDYVERLESIVASPMLEATDRIRLASGRVLERVTTPQYGRGQPIGRVFSFRDITERLASEARLQLAATVFETSLDAIFITDQNHRIVTANAPCQTLMQLSADGLENEPLSHFLYDPTGAVTLDALLDRLPVLGRWNGELHCHHTSGEPTPLQVSLAYEPGGESRAAHCIGVAHDLTEQRAHTQRIHDLSYMDSLTGLPSRLQLAERMEQMIALAEREKVGFAVMLIDLDRFKQINDSLGHPFGDRVLVEMAQRLKGCLRMVDTVGRKGGDEFMAIVHHADIEMAEHVGQRMQQALSEPIVLDQLTFNLTCSIGVAMYPNDGLTVTDLIKNSDSAMSRVKQQGRASLRFYNAKMNVGLLERMMLDQAMRRALTRNQFRLHYQPQIDIQSGEVIGCEALIRWRDEELGEVPPAQFIPVAEESGFIIPIGEWVLNHAVQQAAQWHAKGLSIPVSVNVSALQFHHTLFVDKVTKALQTAKLPAHLLELELTESILIGDGEDILSRLSRLAALGVRMAIDDFGTGYSSLGYLKRLPIHKLKVDRSFVMNLPDDEGDRVITSAVVNLGRSLRIKVIAEGVETEPQRRFLQDLGCDEYQGYLGSRPLPAEPFETFVRAQQFNII